MPIQTVTRTECKIVNRRQLLKSCGVCRRFEKNRANWNFAIPEMGKFAYDLRKQVRLSEHESIEPDIREWWGLEVSRLLHEYESHDVPHREITGQDNYFTSISAISRFANREFTKRIKSIVKGRAGFRCECCNRSWTDITNPDDETLYFRTLEKLWNREVFANDFRLSGLGRATHAEYVVGVGLDRCQNCGAVLQISSRWWTGDPKRIKPSKWFQVHHKNFQHFDNRLENLEYLCSNCHGHKGRVLSMNGSENTQLRGASYVRGLIHHLESRGIALSYIFLSKEGSFSWAVIGERQD